VSETLGIVWDQPPEWSFFRSRGEFADNKPLMSPASALQLEEKAAESRREPAVGTESSAESLNFDDVYQAHFGFVWRVVRRQGIAPEHVDDVCQEVFIIVHRKLPDFEQRAKVRTWLYQIVTNVVRNQRRSIQRKSVHARSRGDVLEPDELNDGAPSPEAHLGRRQAAEVAREILMGMNEKHRMVFVLAELEGMSLRDVAEATGESIHTMRSRLRAARSEFQRHARRMRNVDEWGQNG
jgi:RNA polymerase sigma-70 factor (ECF subfamily)